MHQPRSRATYERQPSHVVRPNTERRNDYIDVDFQRERYPRTPQSRQNRRKRKNRRWGLGLMTTLILCGGIYYTTQAQVEHWFPVEIEYEINQEQIELPSKLNELALLQIIYPIEGETVEVEKVEFATITDSFKVTNRIKPKTVSQQAEYQLFELNIPYQKEPTTLMMTYEVEGKIQRMALGEVPASSRNTQSATLTKSPKLAGDFNESWLANEVSQLRLSDFQFFGEVLRIEASGLESGMMYEWVQEGEVVDQGTYGEKANEGFALHTLKAGHYALRVEGQLIQAPASIEGVWYTVKREGVSKKIQLSESSGFLIVTVDEVTDVPEDVYDLLIDPGHGGIDGGAVGQGKVEAEEVLAVSQYLAKRFEEHGLKVKLTREDMDDPSKSDSHDYDSMPYLENGRVDQVYRYQPKYVISNHLNAFDGSLSGYELYSSVKTNDKWTSLVSNALQATGREARDSLKSEFRQSPGSYKKTYSCDQAGGCDLIYMIRETGGDLTHPVDLPRFSSAYAQMPAYGAESILIEYGYIDHAGDMAKWEDSYQEWAEAVVKGTVEYLEIPYHPLTD